MMAMSTYRLIVCGGTRTTPFADDFTADSVVQAIAQALEAAALAGIPERKVTRVEIQHRERARGEA